MSTKRVTIVALTGLFVLFFAYTGMACEGSDKSESEWSDNGYSAYFCVKQFGEAWGTLNAKSLADVAFQLAEGERVLQRTHRHISSSEAFSLAAEVAAEVRDIETLERLSKSAAVKENGTLLTQIRQDIEQVANAEVAPVLLVSVDTMSVNDYKIYRSTICAIRRAAIANDAPFLKKIELAVLESKVDLPLNSRQMLADFAKTRSANVSASRGEAGLASRANKLPAGVLECDMANKVGCFP